MTISPANNPDLWHSFLGRQPWTPFLQSWTIGDVYQSIGQEPVRLVAEENGTIIAICFAHLVPARRGRHLSVPYGPVIEATFSHEKKSEVLKAMLDALKTKARELQCSFVRVSPFITPDCPCATPLHALTSSPLHLLAEHIWLLPLTGKTEDQILMDMRKTTRNLIRRAEKDGVTVEASKDPNKDIEHFLRLHEETRRRHSFTPYSDKFFREELSAFAKQGQATLYLARYQGEVLAASIHIHAFGEASYHHGASSITHRNTPASYLLQWQAIKDAMKRGDRVYNFWGIAPESEKKHPFAGVTLFKTGFSGHLLELIHCKDIPVSPKYWLTYGFEIVRKWRRGF